MIGRKLSKLITDRDPTDGIAVNSFQLRGRLLQRPEKPPAVWQVYTKSRWRTSSTSVLFFPHGVPVSRQAISPVFV
jgi:hypothetical protein